MADPGCIWLFGRRSVCGCRLSVRRIGCTPAVCDTLLRLWRKMADDVVRGVAYNPRHKSSSAWLSNWRSVVANVSHG